MTDRKTLGWLVEVSKSEGEIADARFILDSKVENKYRYRTTELEVLNRAFSNRGDEVIREEVKIYEQLRQMIVSRGKEIMNTAKVTAELDVMVAHGFLSTSNQLTKPLVTTGREFFIQRGRHPVVESKHLESGRSFIGNSCDLGESSRFALVTGPNMGGKSTFLRQNAIVAIMAQCGIFVPAENATIGVIDAIYTRIGASDDLSRDRSTFMVEMIETASILKNATVRSLVIMDEVGRGTGAEEGFALAQGITKYLLEKGCRTLFATHYHQLGMLVKEHENTQCLMTSLSIEGDEEEIIFLHNITKGVASKSFAIEIAKLAGIPETALKYSKAFLQQNQKLLNLE